MNYLSISERPRPLHDVTDMYMYATIYEQIQLSAGVRQLVANDGKKTAQSDLICIRMLSLTNSKLFSKSAGKIFKSTNLATFTLIRISIINYEP